MNPVQQRFKKDMEEAGFEVETYQGRYFYRGYAVSAGGRYCSYDRNDVIRATKVKLNHDSLGLGTISYPTVSMSEADFALALKDEQEVAEEEERNFDLQEPRT